MIVSRPYNLPAGLPAVSYRPVPDSVAGMVEHVAQVQRALTAPVWYAPRFAALFGGRRWHADRLPSLGFGSNRAADPVITQLICEQVHAKSSARVLEIGAGTSIGSVESSFFGSPWLSRSLQIALRGSIQLVATDFVATNPHAEAMSPVHVVVRAGTELHAIQVNVFGACRKSLDLFSDEEAISRGYPLSAWDEGQGVFQDIPTDHPEFDFVTEAWRGHCEKSRMSPHVSDLHFYVVPALNACAEKHVFGLDVLGGRKFDFTKLHTNKPFSDEKFDFVFGRFLPRLFWSYHWGAIEKGAQSMVASDGRYYIEVDGNRPIQNLNP